MKGVIVKKFRGAGTWLIIGEDDVEYFLGYRQCVNNEKYFNEGTSVTFDVKDTGGKRPEAWNCIAEEPPKPSVTNYERTRKMSVEELAKELSSVSGYEGNSQEVAFWLDWLRRVET